MNHLVRLATVAACFATFAGALSAQTTRSDEGQTLKLLCTGSINGQRLASNLEIDFRRKTVNGHAATITDSLITWAEPSEYGIPAGSPERFELNRLSGTYRRVTGQSLAATYSCEKAGAPKF
jgi:hypothetical protein